MNLVASGLSRKAACGAGMLENSATAASFRLKAEATP